MTKNQKIWTYWILGILFVGTVLVILSSVFIPYLSVKASVLIGALLCIVTIVWSLWQCWNFWMKKMGSNGLKEGYVALLEFYGKYAGDSTYSSLLKDDEGVVFPGPRMTFNLFGIFKLHHRAEEETYYFLGQDYIDLFINSDDFVQFSDGVKAHLEVQLQFKIVNPRKTAFNLGNYVEYLISIGENALRDHCLEVAFEATKESNFAAKVKELMDCETVLNFGGIEIIGISFKEIKLSKEYQDARDKKATADISLEMKDVEIKIAQKDKEISVIKKETEKNKNKVEIDFIKELQSEIGLSGETAAAIYVSRAKWGNIGKNTNATIIVNDGCEGLASAGAQFGVGLKAVSKD